MGLGQSSGWSIGYGSFGVTGRHFAQSGQGSGPYYGAGLGIYRSSIKIEGVGEGRTGSTLGARLLAGTMTKNGSFAEAAYNVTGESATGGLTFTYGFRF